MPIAMACSRYTLNTFASQTKRKFQKPAKRLIAHDNEVVLVGDCSR